MTKLHHSVPREYHSPVPISPGAMLKYFLEEIEITQKELAIRMARPFQTINEIINGKKMITQDTAVQLERVLGYPAYFWVNLETTYRRRLREVEDLKLLKEQAYRLKEFPYKELVERGFIEDSKDKAKQIENALKFLRVTDFNAADKLVDQSVLAFRKSEAFNLPLIKLAAWLELGNIQYQRLELKDYSKEKLERSLSEIRSINLVDTNNWFKDIQAIGCEVGVAFIFTKEFKKFPISGVTRSINNHPVIQLTLRGKRGDKFWFTLFHELAHVLLHSQQKKNVFIDIEENHSKNAIEQEADNFASERLIPNDLYRNFVEGGNFNSNSILQFASKIGVHPGIVVGRLQHDNYVKFNQFSQMMLKVDW